MDMLYGIAEKLEKLQNSLTLVLSILQSKTETNLMEKEYLTPQEVSKLLNIHPRTLQTLRKNKEISFIKDKRKILYLPKDVDEYAKRHWVGKE